MRNLAIVACAAVIVLFAVSGCGTRFSVDGIKNKRVREESVSYRIRSATPEAPQKSAAFQRAAECVKTALSSKGYYEAPPGAPVDLVVDLDYGMEPPQTKTFVFPGRTYPVEAQGGSEAIMNPDGSSGGRSANTVSGSTMRKEPDITKTITTYPKHLRITARETVEKASDHEPRQVWSVYVTNEDTNSDLDAYVPLLAAAAMDKVNDDTEGDVFVVLKPQDERVKFVKSGM